MGAATAALQAELSALQSAGWYQLSSLKKHCAAVGVSAEAVQRASESDSPREQLVT